MPNSKDSVMISFANGILKHFNELEIPIGGEYVLQPNAIQIILKLEGRKIGTTVPYNVIKNSMSHIEAFRTMRFEIILELTNALRAASKMTAKTASSKNTSSISSTKNKGKKIKRKQSRRRKRQGIVP